jgi:hypothetical protein
MIKAIKWIPIVGFVALYGSVLVGVVALYSCELVVQRLCPFGKKKRASRAHS